MDSGYVRPDPAENWVVAGDRRQGEVGAVGLEHGEKPLHVSDGRFQKVRDFPEIGGGGYGEDLSEDPTVLAFPDQSQSPVEVLRHVSDNSADGSLVEGLSGGGDSDGGSEHLGEAVDLLGEVGAVQLGGLGLLGRFDDPIGE